MNDIVSITQTFNDPNNFKNDVSAAYALVMEHFRKKYLVPVNDIYAAERRKCAENPEPKVALLQACRPFVNNTELLDRLIDGLTGYNAIDGIMREYTNNIVTAQVIDPDPSVHEDGVYDVDKECAAARVSEKNENILPLLLAVLLFGGIKK